MSAVAEREAQTRTRTKPGFWTIVSWAALAVFVLFLVFPLARLFGVSLLGAGEGSSFIDTYVMFFTKKYYYQTLLNSITVSIIATVLATAVGVPMAYILNRFNVPGKLIMRAAIVLTFVSPPFIGAYAWILLLGRDGILTRWMATLGIDSPTIYGLKGIVLVYTLQAFPFVFLMVSSGLKSVDQSLEDAAINLGRRPLNVIRSVIMPLIVPAMSTGALLVFVTSFADFGTPMIIGENYRVLASVIYTEFINEHGGNPTVASALSFILLVITVGALFFQRSFARRRAFGQETVRPLTATRLRGVKRTLASLYVYVIVGAACLPLVTIVVSSFLRSRGPLLTNEWTLEGYSRALRLPLSLTNSLVFSSITTILCVFAGCLVGYVVTRRRGKLAGAIDAFSMVPYAIPGIVLGIALTVAFGGSPFHLSGTAVILIIAFFIRRLPYSIRSVAGMLSQIGTQTEEASINLGVPPGRTFWRITVPILTPAVLSGALLTWATIVREFNSTVILYSGSTRTMPVEVFAQVLQGNFGAASVIGTVLIVVSIIPIVILFKFMGKDEEFLV